jgi:hypothetical protein
MRQKQEARTILKRITEEIEKTEMAENRNKEILSWVFFIHEGGFSFSFVSVYQSFSSNLYPDLGLRFASI